MIRQIGQVMLYVNDQDQALRFWTEKAGFIKVSENDNGQGIRWIEIAPAQGASTTFVLHNKQLIAEMQPELNLGTPSILLYSDDLDGLYQDFQKKGITVGDLVNMPGGRVFNFADDENNYFAVMEK
ncbi:VOC family protein [Paenibacillus tianjinensis]|uniref:VOC family protein n=1 Tax=Paenibacillus tianjinensis TaxID=2810347 RepID=A0ABX7LLM0_9BACL|nr:VOC family protein [Paenibacillus tianjinensis]QSF47884.1 VOC family protein [Paenibacillus tianjinensis]